MQIAQDIYSYITSEETNYALPVQVIGDYNWNMKDHIETSILYKNSTYKSGKDDNKPFKNITRPILNLQYRAEGFDVKDIELFVEDKENYYKSFLVKKFHEKWARENDIDTFIDDMVESYVDFGGVLIKKVDKAVPEVVPMQSIAFVDQTDILSGPIAIKHFFSPSQLKDMRKNGWGDKNNGATVTIDELITLSLDQKVKDKERGEVSETPGKYIEIYEVHGDMPEKYLDDDTDGEEYISQMHIVAYYPSENGKQGVTLFRQEEKDSPFKLVRRDKIFGRALGLGGVEELEEAQVWINYDVIRIKEMLDSASKVVHQTDDPSFTNRNNLNDLENGEVLVLEEGKRIGQVDTFPRNMTLFDKSTNEWEEHARQMGSANEVSLAESPKSGTPFRLQALVTQQALSLHEYRKGKISTFLDEVYRDWIIPYISREASKEQEFLAELDLKEMQDIADRLTENVSNEFIKQRVLGGEEVLPEEIEALEAETRESFMKSGNKKFIKILKDEMKDASVSIRINIAGKQEYMAEKVDKLTNVFRTIATNPGVLASPEIADIFNQILESSDISPIDFSRIQAQPQQLTAEAPVAQPTTPPAIL
jgi:hypothetical protein|tara:strand:+ start:761 stop:2539 length:1779 start_codon:yes stop_codon:yes gene_type:complete